MYLTCVLLLVLNVFWAIAAAAHVLAIDTTGRNLQADHYPPIARFMVRVWGWYICRWGFNFRQLVNSLHGDIEIMPQGRVSYRPAYQRVALCFCLYTIVLLVLFHQIVTNF